MGNRKSKQLKKQPAAVTAAAADDQSASPRPAALGEWESPISSAFLTEKAVKLSNPAFRSSDGLLLWLEMRPNEAGRQVLVMRCALAFRHAFQSVPFGV